MACDLKVYAGNLEPAAIEQIHTLAEQEAFAGCKVRIMPDAHAGAGCAIGFTANLGEKVVPNLVGVDIGCGMFATVIPPIEDFEELDRQVRCSVPSGFKVHASQTIDVEELGLLCYESLGKIEHLNRSMGTLGGGNHFVEVDVDETGKHWLVIHSGSRNLGLQVASIYQQKAAESCEGKVPSGLEYLTGELADAYLHDMRICQQWARENRERMMANLIGGLAFGSDDLTDSFHTVHNYIGDDGIIRKGAISAYEGERVLIPFNMRDGSIIGVGKGNEDWNHSAPHGAGRLMSRSKARELLSLDEFKAQMEGVWSSTVERSTIDEAPGAYKPVAMIMDALDPTVEIVHRLKPLYNFKATDGGKRPTAAPSNNAVV